MQTGGLIPVPILKYPKCVSDQKSIFETHCSAILIIIKKKKDRLKSETVFRKYWLILNPKFQMS